MRCFRLPLFTAILLQAGAEAAEMAVEEPVQMGAEFLLDAYFTNDDPGAVYNSAKTLVVSSSAMDIFA